MSLDHGGTERFNRWQEELATIRVEIRDLEVATFDPAIYINA
jgi:hypothetical protein